MPGKRSFDEQIAALDKLRQLPAESCIDPLRTALEQRNNFVVGKAAHLIREFQLPQLTPELLIAFDRFFENPAKTDPQCWAKNALAAPSPRSSIRTRPSFFAACAISNSNRLGRDQRYRRNSTLNLRFGPGAMPHPG
jgi:hypothetical protein